MTKNVYRSALSFFYTGLILFTLVSTNAFSQGDTSVISNKGLITSGNVEPYRELLPLEVFELIQSGNLTLRYANTLSYDWKHSAKLKDSQNSPSRDTIITSLEKLWALTPIHKSKFELVVFKDTRQPTFQFKGSKLRVYTHSVKPTDSSVQLYRELVKFSKPRQVKNYSFLTYRFSSSDNDRLWVYSSALKTKRRLTFVNRYDSIALSNLSLDDFSVFSGHQHDFKIVGVEERRQLVVFPSVEPARIQIGAGGCMRVDTSELPESLFAFESERLSAATSWSTVQAVAVPRDVLIFELQAKDPFMNYQSVTLVVDKESSLPVYKIVKDTEKKVIIGAFDFARIAKSKEKADGSSSVVESPDGLWSPRFVLSFSKNKQPTVLKYKDVNFCDSVSAPDGEKLLAALTPKSLG